MKRTIGIVVCGLVVSSGAAFAQGSAFGIGPRVTFQSTETAAPDASALRVFGGQVKLRLGKSAAIEVSADYDSKLNESLNARAKTMPIQASLLYFPIHSAVSPYLLGGIGWYRHSITAEPDADVPSAGAVTTTIRERGYHLGLGAELRFGQHIAFHGDYRYNHLHFGSASTEAEPQSPSSDGGILGGTFSIIPKLSSIQQSLRRSSEGSMWNWGLTFFF